MHGSDLFCAGCGTPADKARGTAATPVSPVATSTGLACKSCGAPLNPGDVFCMSCGAKVEAAVEETVVEESPAPTPDVPAAPVCKTCGAPLNPGDMFCMGCGAKVEATDGPAVVAEETVVVEEIIVEGAHSAPASDEA